MAKVKITLNTKGVGEILKGDKMRADMQRRGDAIARAAGDGFECQVVMGRTRVRAMVFAVTHEAAARQRKDKRLTRAFDAGRG